VLVGVARWHCVPDFLDLWERIGASDSSRPLHFHSRYPDAGGHSWFVDGASFGFGACTVSGFGAFEHHRFHQGICSMIMTTTLWPNQGAAANRRPAGQLDGSGNLFAIVAADRAFPAAVAELGR
jgi:hypothetical protein